MNSLHYEPIHMSLHRQTLFMGGDREMVMLSGLGAFIVATGMTLYTFIAALAFWMTSLYWIRRWTKNDHLFRPVFLRYRLQQDLYLAKSSMWVRIIPNKSPWRK